MNLNKTVRLHDKIYLKENRYKKPKEIFIRILKLVKKSGVDKKKDLKIGDFGCSNGEFCYFLKKNFYYSNITGYDVVKDLITKAKKKVKDVKFIQGSVLNSNLVTKNQHDLSFCIGVISIFDSFEQTLNNLIKWTKPNGKIYIFSFFNNYPLDVNIKFSKSENWMKNKPKFWESGYNVFSKKTLSKFLKNEKSIKNFKFYDFSMKKNLKINHKDYLRSWTFNDNKNKKILIIGTNLLHCFSILEINLKK